MIRIGIICPSEIAFRRFLPALKLYSEFQFMGIAIASSEEWHGSSASYDQQIEEDRVRRERDKACQFIKEYGSGQIFNSYTDLVSSDLVDVVYLPLPPALHYKWTKLAVMNGKHTFVEKPFTTDFSDAKELIELARLKNVALYENYMFIYHNQLQAVNDVVKSGEIGDVRLYRITFGFPRKAANDFRYNKSLGGGALIDAGGYTIKYASSLLGSKARLTTANLNFIPEFDVDVYGTATMINEQGVTAQLAFGMDCDYRCDIEIWGSQGTITSNRILTAPSGFVPEYTVKKNQCYETRPLPSDDAFSKSISYFKSCIIDVETREMEFSNIYRESELLDQFIKLAK
jgi:NDP-hexose-3-ketoreductase